MDKQLILQVKTYLEQKPEERDLEAGALLVLRLNNNRIMYNNFMRRPQHYASRIEYELQKRYNFFVKELTHEQVADMQRQVATIVRSHHLDKEEVKNAVAGTSTAQPTASVSATGTSNEEFKKGKRSDHDALPEEIQALYATNMSIMQRMRMLHTKLQLLSTENSPCPDSERYPFLKELIELDKKYHENWNIYDHFVLSGGSTSLVVTSVEEEEAEEKVESDNKEEAVSTSAQDSADNSAETRPDSVPATSEAPAEPKKKITRRTQKISKE